MVRFDGRPAVPLTVVAVYDRGLGFGDYAVSTSTLAAQDVTARPDAVLVTASIVAALGAWSVTHARREKETALLFQQSVEEEAQLGSRERRRWVTR